MISHKFSKSFYSFIENEKSFSGKEKESIINIFQNNTVQIIFSVSLYLVIWSFVVAFIDASLVTRGVVFTVHNFGILNSFLPSIIFIGINAFVKFHFIYFYTKNKIDVSLKQIFIGIIPIVGSIFFTAYLLKNEPLVAQAMKKYLKYIRKDFKWIHVLKEKTK